MDILKGLAAIALVIALAVGLVFLVTIVAAGVYNLWTFLT